MCALRLARGAVTLAAALALVVILGLASVAADDEAAARTGATAPAATAATRGSEIMGSVMAFSLADPPPLAEPGRLLRFGTAAGLLGYVRATMPRWAPGSLDDGAYLDVSHLTGPSVILPSARVRL